MNLLVGPEGPLDAKIVLIGEAPGEKEQLTGRPFMGGSGQLLSQVLAKNGINRASCYITNIMQIRPGGNDFGQFYDDKKRTQPKPILIEGIRRLESELQRLRPNIIVPLGSEPLRAITGLRSIDKWRGSILTSKFGKVVGSYHPAYILRDYKSRPIFELDFKRIAKQSGFPQVRIPSHTFHIDPRFEFVIEWLKAIQKGQTISFDIETVGDLIRCLGIGISAHEAMCIPFMSSPWRLKPGMTTIDVNCVGSPTKVSSHWTETQEYVILQELNRIMADGEIKKVAQNFPFDSTRLEKQFGLVTRGLRLDTLLGWHTLYCELPKGLDFLCSVLTEVPYYSDYNVSSDYEVWRYNCFDAAVTWEIVSPIEDDLRSTGLLEFYVNHVQPAMMALTRAQNRGIRVDEQKMKEEREKLLLEIEYPHKKHGWTRVGSLTQTLRDMTGEPNLNPNSPVELSELFYVKLGLAKQFNHKTKQLTADKNARETLARKYPQYFDLFKRLDEWSQKETLVTGFLSRKPRANGRMFTAYNVGGTLTGRISSSDPLDEPGTNLTNIPRGEFRRIFLSDEKEWLIKADLKSAEWMVVCWKSPIKRFIEKYRENPDWDVHRYAASRVYSVEENLVTKQQRSLSKNGVYGGNYGMQAPRASQTWKIPVDEADFILRRWRAEVPEIQYLYWKGIQECINSTRSLTNSLGRRRMFFDRINPKPSDLDQIYRDAYSHYAQSTVADLINRAFALMDHYFVEEECKLLLQVHDEIVGTCKTPFVGKYVDLFKRFMEYPLYFPGTETALVIKAEVTVGPTWYDQESYEQWRLKHESPDFIASSTEHTRSGIGSV